MKTNRVRNSNHTTKTAPTQGQKPSEFGQNGSASKTTTEPKRMIDTMVELESAVDQSKALSEILFACMGFEQLDRGIIVPDEKKSGSFLNGLEMLKSGTNNRLKAAFEAAHHAACNTHLYR